jgi:hypothetical protein
MPVWGVVTAAAAPILLVAGWTIAARLQRGGFDPVTETISHLAGGDASHRWVMTTAILGTGGLCTILVGLSPLPPAGQASTVHTVVAAGSFAALATWPLVSWRRGESVPWGPRRGVAVSAGCGLVAVTAWFFRDVVAEAATVRLSEREDAVLLNLWPVAVAVSAWRQSARSPR